MVTIDNGKMWLYGPWKGQLFSYPQRVQVYLLINVCLIEASKDASTSLGNPPQYFTICMMVCCCLLVFFFLPKYLTWIVLGEFYYLSDVFYCIALWIWFALISLSAKPKKYNFSLWKAANAFMLTANCIFGEKKRIVFCIMCLSFLIFCDVCREMCFQPFHLP